MFCLGCFPQPMLLPELVTQHQMPPYSCLILAQPLLPHLCHSWSYQGPSLLAELSLCSCP